MNNNIIFQRLTGKTDFFGTIKISLVSNPLNFKTVSIYQTGIVEKIKFKTSGGGFESIMFFCLTSGGGFESIMFFV